MSLSIGIIGLPNVGKSTLFNALLKRQAALAANYPFATIEPNVGVVDVPDARLDGLAALVKQEFTPKNSNSDRALPEKIIPAVVKFYDIAGLVKGASTGEGLGNQFLSHIRETDALIQVVRNFEDSNVIRAGSTNPQSDIETINTELILADLDTLNKKLVRLETDMRKDKSKEMAHAFELCKKIHAALNASKLASTAIETPEEAIVAKTFNLLTLKPMIYVMNVSETELNGPTDSTDQIRVSAKIESELCSLSKEDQELFKKDLGITESGLDKIIRRGFDLLGLQTYLTAGPKEVRAWTIHKGFKAPQAAGVIHTDFERGFISAEVVSYDDLISAQGWKGAKDKGLIRIEGKEYIMRDGAIFS
jgi:GTP-binding protein YchF